MSLATATEVIPFDVAADGIARVGGTRVTLDTIIAAFSDGATAEEIAQQYPSLNLADVYYVIHGLNSRADGPDYCLPTA